MLLTPESLTLQPCELDRIDRVRTYQRKQGRQRRTHPPLACRSHMGFTAKIISLSAHSPHKILTKWSTTQLQSYSTSTTYVRPIHRPSNFKFKSYTLLKKRQMDGANWPELKKVSGFCTHLGMVKSLEISPR